MGPSSTRRAPRVVAAIAGIAALATAALATAVLLQAPGANGPQEWRWEYRPLGLDGGWLPALLALALLAIYLVWDRRESWHRAVDAGFAVLLAVAGCGFTLALAGAQPGGLERVLASLASRLSFSYVYDAGLAPPTRELLADYPAASARLDLHARTHPPGAILAVRAVDRLTRALPAPPPGESAGIGGIGAAARDALDREITRSRDRRRPVPSHPPGPWTIVVLAFLLPALSAAAAWPLFRLATAWGLPPSVARAAALLWLAVPARSLFTPSLDQALPLLAVGAIALAAGSREGRAGALRAFAAGLLLFLAAFLSYGCLALAPWAAAIAMAPPASREDDPTPRRRLDLVPPALLGLGFLLPWIALVPLAGYAPWTAFRAAMSTHRTMAVVTRGYLTWLVWNPYDLFLLLGPPILALGVAALALARGRGNSYRVGICGFWGLLALLWISGSVRGEVGRIWLLFMPFACLFAAGALAELPALRRWALGMGALELALTLALGASMVFVS